MLKKHQILSFLLITFVSISCAQKVVKTNDDMRQELAESMQKSHDWMWENRSLTKGGQRADWDWTNATWFAGSMELYKVSQNPELLKQLRSVGEGLDWTIGDQTPGDKHDLQWYRSEYAKFQESNDKNIIDIMEHAGKKTTSFADNHTIIQVYADLAKIDKKNQYLDQTNKAFLALVDENLDVDMTDHLAVCWSGEWSWCDSLFMGPPAFAKIYDVTGNKKYLDFMDRKWWKAYDLLYDKKEMLFYRDASYLSKKEANGAKVFWSRGNGWVMGGLVRVLEVMPKDYPTRPQYIQLFKEMSAKISSIQQDDGFWRASLLDPTSFPGGETSGTGFFCYALAWGINNGYLDKRVYLPVVKRSINALMRSVDKNGKVGWVQAIGKDPKQVQAGDTEVYGVGAFLLAGSEVYKVLGE
ncbi:glycoside hydrolase family 88 protein [Lentisphaera profundi]|uniref:Glycoside hydrolase family 88 protein n=1 Tax=Lentisphaera profundi TaxID=1658616 RepID=A0ABY7VNC6_9BACT|nr:glycoside hydrolase family 88 protein [Lentisphaera profundi]WDE95613.1 glycoside hydrolase family 88 protein [Lentisphaera profundi]